MKHFLILLLFLSSLIINLTANEENLSIKNNAPVKIGVMLPLTGEAAFIGQPMKNAVELAFENEKRIQLVFQDTKASPKDSVSIYKKFNEDKIKYIIGPASSGTVLAIAPLVEKENIFLVTPSASHPKLTKYKKIFRVELSDNQGAFWQAKHAFESFGWKNISIIYINNDYGAGIEKVFRKEFEKLGGNINISLAYDAQDTDFRTYITKLKNYTNDSIFIIAQNKYPSIIKQLREMGVNDVVYATPVINDTKIFEELGNKLGRLAYTYYGEFNTEKESMASKNFKKKYEKKYGEDPTYFAALAYDASKVVKNKIFQNNTDKFIGVTGNISFDENGDVEKQVLIYKNYDENLSETTSKNSYSNPKTDDSFFEILFQFIKWVVVTAFGVLLTILITKFFYWLSAKIKNRQIGKTRLPRKYLKKTNKSLVFNDETEVALVFNNTADYAEFTKDFIDKSKGSYLVINAAPLEVWKRINSKPIEHDMKRIHMVYEDLEKFFKTKNKDEKASYDEIFDGRPPGETIRILRDMPDTKIFGDEIKGAKLYEIGIDISENNAEDGRLCIVYSHPRGNKAIERLYFVHVIVVGNNELKSIKEDIDNACENHILSE